MLERLDTPESVAQVLSLTCSDQDGVMQNTRKHVTGIYNNRYGTEHTYDEIRDWTTLYDWGLEIGMPPKEALAVEAELWRTPEIVIGAEPIPGAIEFLERAYYDYKIRIPIVSSRLPKLYDCTVEWYRARTSVVTPEQIFVGLPDIASGEISKVLRVMVLGKKYHLEDSHTQVQLFLDYTDDINILYLSNRTILDRYLSTGRLIRFPGENGGEPTMWPIYELFFGPRPDSVAQSIDNIPPLG